jgi:hypothetical protein
MKVILFVLTLLSLSANADEYVNGYFRRDGGYVQGYHRTEPNNTTLDNYSHKGNINPYTFEQGTRNDDRGSNLIQPSYGLDYRERGNTIFGR